MLDKQNQGRQCWACGFPMKLIAIEHQATRVKICGPTGALNATEVNGTSSTVP
jgi:hypothetical protein